MDELDADTIQVGRELSAEGMRKSRERETPVAQCLVEIEQNGMYGRNCSHLG